MLVTDRLELWQPQVSDREGLRALIESDAVRRFLGGMEPDDHDVFMRLLRNAGSWALYGYGTFVVRERGGDEIVGNCGVFHSWRGFGRGLDDVAEAAGSSRKAPGARAMRLKRWRPRSPGSNANKAGGRRCA